MTNSPENHDTTAVSSHQQVLGKDAMSQHPKKKNAKELLLRLQQEETAKQGQRYVNPEAIRPVTRNPLDIARRGAGTDFGDPRAHEQALLRGRMGNGQGTIESCLPVTETGNKRIEQASENHDKVAQRTSAGETVLKRPADYVPMLGDWNYPQWNVKDSYVYTSDFRMWLVNVAETEPASNAPRLEDRELFLEGKLHLDPVSETGVEP